MLKSKFTIALIVMILGVAYIGGIEHKKDATNNVASVEYVDIKSTP